MSQNHLNRITAIEPSKKRQKNDPLWPLGSKRIAIPLRRSNSRRKLSAHAIAKAFTRSRTQDESLAILCQTATSSSSCKSMAEIYASSGNPVKIKHSEIGNICHGYQMCVQGVICKERHSVKYILCLYTIYEHFGSV